MRPLALNGNAPAHEIETYHRSCSLPLTTSTKMGRVPRFPLPWESLVASRPSIRAAFP